MQTAEAAAAAALSAAYRRDSTVGMYRTTLHLLQARRQAAFNSWCCVVIVTHHKVPRGCKQLTVDSGREEQRHGSSTRWLPSLRRCRARCRRSWSATTRYLQTFCCCRLHHLRRQRCPCEKEARPCSSFRPVLSARWHATWPCGAPAAACCPLPETADKSQSRHSQTSIVHRSGP